MINCYGVEVDIPDSQFRDWCFMSPTMNGVEYVEAYRPDGLFGWDRPSVIKASADPMLNVAGLHWRPAPKPA